MRCAHCSARYGNEAALTIILFTLDEMSYARELAPLAGHYPALKLGPRLVVPRQPRRHAPLPQPDDRDRGFLQHSRASTTTSRAFLSIPARHDVARAHRLRLLAQLVAEHRMEEWEAAEPRGRPQLQSRQGCVQAVRLTAQTTLPASVEAPGYRPRAQAAGIVHIGIGAFHRAHQAVYTDDAMGTGDRDWGIIGVSLRSGDVAAQLRPQDGLYTVSTRGVVGSELRLVGAVQTVLVATDDPQAVIDAIAAPTTHIVSFTVTEKGYLRRADGSLDLAAAVGASSLYRFVTAGLMARKAAGLAWCYLAQLR